MDDNIDMEKLIREIQERPAIWNMASPEYSDRLKRKQSWEEITNLFVGDCTKEEKHIMGTLLQKKWKNARDRYTRDHNCRVGGKAKPWVKRKTPYMFASQMSFLYDTVQLRCAANSTLNNENENSRTSDDHVIIKEEAEAPLTTQENTPTDVNLEVDRNESENNTSPANKKLKTSKKKDIPLVEVKLLEALEYNLKRREAKEKEEEDDDRLFLLSMLPHLKKLPPHMKLSVRMDILQAVNKYVMQTAMMTQDQSTHFNPFPAESADQQDLIEIHKEEILSRTGTPVLSPNASVHSLFSNYSASDCDVKPF